MVTLRAAVLFFCFVVATVFAIIWQGTLVSLKLRERKAFPTRYHSFICRLFGFRLHSFGTPLQDGGMLVVANHVSYLDIIFIGSLVRRLSFVSRQDVSKWPIVGTLVWLQESVLIDRKKRGKAGEQMDAIRSRLKMGDAIAMFAEGTTTDGNRILPFKSSLIGSAFGEDGFFPIQPVSIRLVGLHGMPMNRADRHYFSWTGDVALLPHVWQMLNAGPLDVVVEFHPPILDAPNRKSAAAAVEATVRKGWARAPELWRGAA